MRLDGNFLAVASHDNFVYVYAVTENGRKYSRVGKCTVITHPQILILFHNSHIRCLKDLKIFIEMLIYLFVLKHPKQFWGYLLIFVYNCIT